MSYSDANKSNATSPPQGNEAAPFGQLNVSATDKDILPKVNDRVAQVPPQMKAMYRPGVHAATEYVSGHKGLFYVQFIKALPQYVDDLQAELGDDIYERMSFDPQVDSCMRVLVMGILAGEGKVVSPITDEQDERYEQAQEIAEFVERAIKSLRVPLELTLYEMVKTGLAMGHKVSEVVYELNTDGQDKGKWGIRAIRTKPRGTTAFLTDAFMQVVGVLATVPGLAYPVLSGQLIASPESIPNLLAREKFMVFTNDPKDGDPRGRSVLRCIYNPWWAKMQTWGEMLKYLAAYGNPSLWGTTAANAEPRVPVDSAGNPTGAAIVTPESDMTTTLAALRQGSVAAFPYGTTINALPVSTSEHQVHMQVIDMTDRQMAKGLLAQTLATEEGEHMARAASDNHMDILGLTFKQPRGRVQHMVKDDLFRNLVMVNYGEEAAKHLTPDYLITDSEKADQDRWAQAAVSMFTSGYITQEQKLWIDKKLGLPAPAEKEHEDQIDPNMPAMFVVEEKKMQLEMQAQQQQQAAQGGQGQPGQPGQPNGGQGQPQQSQPQGLVPAGYQQQQA